jgi:hypothetical protein
VQSHRRLSHAVSVPMHMHGQTPHARADGGSSGRSGGGSARHAQLPRHSGRSVVAPCAAHVRGLQVDEERSATGATGPTQVPPSTDGNGNVASRSSSSSSSSTPSSGNGGVTAAAAAAGPPSAATAAAAAERPALGTAGAAAGPVAAAAGAGAAAAEAAAAAAGTASAGTAEPVSSLWPLPVGPVATCQTVTLPPAASLPDALDALLAAVEGSVGERLGQASAALGSGCVRVEVPLPRGTSALRWLQGQAGSATATRTQPSTESTTSGSDSTSTSGSGSSSSGSSMSSPLAPHVYFSGRHSSAPDTRGTFEAEAVTRGWSAVAGEAIKSATLLTQAGSEAIEKMI